MKNLVFQFDEAGSYENTFLVTDNNGNVGEKQFTVEVIKNYLAHVQGIQEEIIVKQNTEGIDRLEGVTYDEKVIKVETDNGKSSRTRAGSGRAK